MSSSNSEDDPSDDDRVGYTGDHEVGYCRPPAEHRFKPGEVHNRRGRPRQALTFDEALKRVLAEKIPIRIGEEVVRATKGEAIAHRLVDRYAKGDAMAQRLLLSLLAEFDRDATSEQNPTLSGVWTVPDDFDQAMEDAYGAERKCDPHDDEDELRRRALHEALLAVGQPNDPGNGKRIRRRRA